MKWEIFDFLKNYKNDKIKRHIVAFFCWNDIINTVFHKFLWKTRNGGAQKCVCYYRRKGTLSYEST